MTVPHAVYSLTSCDVSRCDVRRRIFWSDMRPDTFARNVNFLAPRFDPVVG